MDGNKLLVLGVALFIIFLFYTAIAGVYSSFKLMDTSKCTVCQEKLRPIIIECKEKLESTEFDLENYKVLLKQSRETVK